MSPASRTPSRPSRRPCTVLLLTALLAITPACEAEPAGDAERDGWLTGSEEERHTAIERQLGGFSATMWEVGYRYNVLYWAGEDRNWELAAYQIEKIRSAMENGFERRPAREPSAESFMESALPALDSAVRERDPVQFEDRFLALTLSCNRCHVDEGIGYARVTRPDHRAAPLGPPTDAPADESAGGEA